jgi:PAS domain S-box-containing protein
VRAVVTTGEPLAYEAVRELPQGRLVVLGRMLPLGGSVVLAMDTDVSRERETEAQLAQLEALAEIGLWAWNVVDDVATWSDQYRRLHGLPPDLAPSTAAALALVHPDDREAVEALTAGVRTNGRVRPFRYRIVRPDGEIRHVEGRAETVTDAQGDVIRVVGTIQDVTDQQALEERERRLREAAQRQAHALELNDDIVQELSRAWLALELEDLDTVRGIIEHTTRRVQAIVSDLLSTAATADGRVSPGDLVRERAAGQEVTS